jgi:WhiB family redox-sensing transcriptional regulator
MFDTTEAACVNEDPEIFFPYEPSLYLKQVKQAKEVCASCPLKMNCLAEALVEKHEGIWGGTTAADRGRIRKNNRKEIILNYYK